MSAVAEIFLKTGSWNVTKEIVLKTNALQCRSSASSERLEREIRPRLQRMTPEQLQEIAHADSQSRTCLAWLAAVKQSAFLFDFAADLLRGKLELHDRVLRESDYRRFLEEKSPLHPEIGRLSAVTEGKVRRVLFAMLREMRILNDCEDGIGGIERPLLPYQVENLIRQENPALLAAFLVPENEIRR